MAQAFRSTRVLTPEGVKPAAILVEGEQISGVVGWGDVPADTLLHDYGELVVMPGMVDSHVHINEPGRTDWEGFETATRAAAAGGVTTLIDMPLNCVPEVTSAEALTAKRQAAVGKAYVDWAAWGGVVRGNAEALPALIAAGVPGFKCFLIHSGIEGFSQVHEADLRLALEKLRGSGVPLLAHAEMQGPVTSATEQLIATCQDWRRYSTYLHSRPDEAETEAIDLLIRLAEEFGQHIHIVHLASARAVQALAAARSRGVPITVETCPHYLCISAEEIPNGATEFKCAPPIRNSANREALWRALEEGVIDMIVTDHSPCPPSMKRLEEARWDLAWGGISSLGLALPLVWTELMKRGKGVKSFVEGIGRWMSTAPATLAGMTGTKGSFVSGADADFVVFDPDIEWTVAEKDLYFRHKLSPYIGRRLAGQVKETWLRGNLAFSRSEDSTTRFSDRANGREWVRP